MKAKNRCQSLSPGTRWRCIERRGHISRDKSRGVALPKHRHEWATWSDDEGVIGPLQPIEPKIGAPVYSVINEQLDQLPDVDPAEVQLRTWWHDTAASEIEKTVPKAIEYGSTDLIDIGVMLARTMRREVSEEEAAELGVFFYLIGKIARWQSAIERGERPSDDTLLDIGVYVRMAQRIRHAGGWPGVNPPADKQ